MRALFFVLAIATSVLTSRVSHALSLSLLPQTQQVFIGDVVAIDVWIDFDQWLLGGGFDIQFDPDALAFESLDTQSVGSPDFFRAPTEFPGLLESWAIGDFAGLVGQHFLGTVYFTVLPGMGASTHIVPSDTNGIGGPWIDGFQDYNLDYHPAELTRMPVPAAGWLMLCALGTLVLGRRPRTPSS